MNNWKGWCLTLITIIALILAAKLAYHDKQGWGWMIFVSLLTCPSGNDFKGEEENKDENN